MHIITVNTDETVEGQVLTCMEQGVKKTHLQSISPPLQQKGDIGGGGRKRDMRW